MLGPNQCWRVVRVVGDGFPEVRMYGTMCCCATWLVFLQNWMQIYSDMELQESEAPENDDRVQCGPCQLCEELDTYF